MATRTRREAKTMEPEVQECIDRCRECEEICLASLPHCLELGGRHAEPDHLILLSDCAEICATSARFMIRGSGLHSRVCGVCAEVCEACARDCKQLGDDPMMRECADACDRCADSCRRMASM